MHPPIETRPLGTLPEGEIVQAWMLTGTVGLRLRCIGYPDRIRHPAAGSILLSPGQTKRESSAYAFSNLTEEDVAFGVFAATGRSQS